MWKDFFYYSRSERRAIYVVLTLIAFLVLIIIFVPERSGSVSDDSFEKDSMELKYFLASVQQIEKKHHVSESRQQKKSEPVVLKLFNPNTIDSIEMRRMGISAYVAHNVVKYRKKGGRFSTPEAFERIYGLSKEQYESLRPYIQIPVDSGFGEISTQRTEKGDSSVYTSGSYVKSFKYPEGVLVDINHADTVELKKIPGIGSVIAKMIVSYRNQLGGFYQLSQLKEVKYVTPDIMKWCKLESIEIRKLSVNRASLDKLRSHPYLNFYQAKVIVEYRRKKGKIKSLSQLALYEEFTEKDLERLSNYLAFD